MRASAPLINSQPGRDEGPEEAVKGIRLIKQYADAVLANPALYPEVRAKAIQAGVVKQKNLPTKWGPKARRIFKEISRKATEALYYYAETGLLPQSQEARNDTSTGGPKRPPEGARLTAEDGSVYIINNGILQEIK